MVIGQEGSYSLLPLEAIHRTHRVVGVVESSPRGYEPDPPPSTMRGRLFSLVPRDRPGRGALRRRAERWGVPYFLLTKATASGLIPFLKARAPDLICVASMSQLLGPEALRVPRWGALNLHPSLLPKYRGPVPWFWHYHQMEKEMGVTVHRIDEGVDTGNILRQASFPIPLGMTSTQMRLSAGRLGARLMLEAIEDASRGEEGRAQRHLPCPLYARRVDPREPLIDWDWPLERVWHVLRGAGEWLRPIPSLEGWRRDLPWRVLGFSREASAETPGSLARDRSGYFLSHREGKIRLSPDYRPLLSRDFWQRKAAASRRIMFFGKEDLPSRI